MRGKALETTKCVRHRKHVRPRAVAPTKQQGSASVWTQGLGAHGSGDSSVKGDSMLMLTEEHYEGMCKLFEDGRK